MERTQKTAVVAGHFGWSDVGAWAAVWELSEKKANGNAIDGHRYVLDAANNLIRSEEALVAVIGLDDIAVISTRDAVLVTPGPRPTRSSRWSRDHRKGRIGSRRPSRDPTLQGK